MGVFLEDIWLESALGIIALSYIFYQIWTRNYTYWKDRRVPYVEPSFPFGNTKDFVLARRFPGHVYKDLYFQLKGHRYGGLITLRKPELMIRDPDVIKLILTKDFNHFTDRGVIMDEEIDPLSAHLFSLTGEKWRILRSKLTPTFTSGKMKMMFHLMKACAKELDKSLLNHAEREDVIELKDFLARFGTDIIGSCAFGLEIDSLNHPDSEFRKISQDIFKPRLSVLFRVFMDSVIPNMSKVFRVKTTPKEREDFFFKIVGDTVEYREKNKIKRNDFLDLLIQIKNKGHVEDDPDHLKEKAINDHVNNDHQPTHNSHNDIYMTKELMAAQCFVFFVAGFETSSTAQSFCLYELSLHKDIQKNMQDEIDKVLAKHNGEISYEALKEMTYMERVVQETLRKYPPLGNLTRDCVADYMLPDSNLIIEKGTKIIVPLYGIHYDPEYYPDPEHFDPERFTEEAKASRPHYTFLPFGEGPRLCIGMRFGMLQVKTGLTTLLSKYNFDRVPETQVPVQLDRGFLASPKNGIRIKISKRKK